MSDFLMVTLAKGTVAVGKKVGAAVAESDVCYETVAMVTCMIMLFRWLKEERLTLTPKKLGK